METRDWSAWRNRMPKSEDPKVYVAGTCVLDSSSTTVHLEPTNEGWVDDPAVYALKLVVERPDIGDTQSIERTVDWNGDVEPTVNRVRIDGADTVSIWLTVEDRY